jgi:hypothetical protein
MGGADPRHRIVDGLAARRRSSPLAPPLVASILTERPLGAPQLGLEHEPLLEPRKADVEIEDDVSVAADAGRERKCVLAVLDLLVCDLRLRRMALSEHAHGRDIVRAAPALPAWQTTK